MDVKSRQVGSSSESFVQARVAREGLAGFALSGVALLFRVIGVLVLRDISLSHPSILAHALATALLFALFLLHRGKARSPAFVRVSELVLLVGSSVAMSAMIPFIPVEARPDMIALMAMSLIAMSRAILVPSTPRYSMLLTTLLGVPIIVFTILVVRRLPLLVPGRDPVVVVGVATACWWSLTVLLATSTTRVIFGLRREVRAAKRLGQYELLETIGEGGMGIVYRAQHALMRRPTAIKLLPSVRNSPEEIARFEREVRLTASLTHPNTVTVFDYGRTPDGTFYYAMEFLDGPNLEQIVEASGPMPPARVVHVLAQIAGALVEAHAAGLVHRDIKPANVLLCRRGGVDDVAKVVDFGLVKRFETGADIAESRVDRIAGTPLYLSPEAIARPNEVGPASDLYALGATAYYLMTGAPPFEAPTPVELYAAHLHKEPEPPSRRLGTALDPTGERLEALVMAMLAKDPRARLGSAADLRVRLIELARAMPWVPGAARSCVVTPTVGGAAPSPHAKTVAVDFARR